MNYPLHDQTIQYQRGYSLLGKIFAEGLTAEVMAVAQDIPVLYAVLPEDREEDTAGAEYQDLFGFNVLPYAGVFLTEDGKLGGVIHQELNALYDAYGFEPDQVVDVPDHMSTQLEYVAFLLNLELTAAKAPTQKLVRSAIRKQQGDFLQKHLIPWCFPFFCSVKAQQHAFYAEVAELTKALIINHVSEVGSSREVYMLPASPNILNNPKTGVKDIAEFLCRPAYCGVHLTRKEIKGLAGSLGIPSGFGDRVQTLSNTFRSAINFDTVPALLQKLRQHVQFYRTEYEAQNELGVDQVQPIIAQWIQKTDLTLGLISKIENELSRFTELD